MHGNRYFQLFRIIFFDRGLGPPVPSCGTPKLVQMMRDWGGAKLQEQYRQGQTATEETEDTEDAHV